ncbi:MAG TPA: hypothetical protein PLY87_05825 [Planctomycetaceae bacterium]|nr:hypothetical protein [Planctomycetaceae bacterium]
MEAVLMMKKEVAYMLKVSTRTVDRWRAMAVDLGEIKVGNQVRF